jgi:hypothetical protein
MTDVLIHGDGIAALCCARLLAGESLNVRVQRTARPKLPAIMLGEGTQKLLSDVCRSGGLFDGLPRVRKRIVAWGRRGPQPLTLAHSAIVVSEQQLLERIASQLPEGSKSADWTIFASAPAPASVEQHFGCRTASASPVIFKAGRDPEACWIESLNDGWLFLLPTGNGAGWLLSVAGAADSMLGSSSLVHEQIAELSPARGTFTCHPRAALPLSGSDWLSCGTAALAFDPLCGDGTGNAVREAILASAVIRAANAGADTQSLVSHYEARLLAGLQRHLKLCFDFYKSGHSGP